VDIASFEDEAWYADVCVGGVKVAALALRLLSTPLSLVSTAMGAMLKTKLGSGVVVYGYMGVLLTCSSG
jgi:hypothetical protein